MTNKAIRMAQFYSGMVFIAAGLFLLPLPRLAVLSFSVVAFLLWRIFDTFLERFFSPLFSFYSKKSGATGKFSTTVLGIENSRFFWVAERCNGYRHIGSIFMHGIDKCLACLRCHILLCLGSGVDLSTARK